MRYLNYIVPLFIVLLKINTAFANDYPAWWSNEIGKEKIVLPGFQPILISGQNINLGVGRSYHWNNGLLPIKMTARNKEWVVDNRFELEIDGKKEVIQPHSFEIIHSSGHDVELLSVATVSDKLKIHITSKIEYDGLVMLEIELIPLKNIGITKFHHVMNVVSTPWMKMLAFEPETVHVRKKKVVFDPQYRGRFLNALALVDGNRSFWWFVDNAEGWVNNPDDATEIKKFRNTIEVRQKIIDKKININKKISFSINLLVTPVKDGNGNIRQNRYVRRLSNAEAKHQGVNIWWTTAFAHQVLPYLEYPQGVKAKINKKDILIYPGLKKNRQLLTKYHAQNIYKLPYFSAHVLNHLDPAYEQFHDEWAVHPEIVWKRKYDWPYATRRNDAFLTHRAKGYTNYLISRFSSMIDKLGFEGLYFDQGGVMSSRNPVNGLWLDANGKKRNSTDILALRAFHKRLATLFYLKGKKGLIFSHNSNTAIVPAYSFITAMVQGEEYNHWLKNYDYIDSVELDEVRSRIGSSAFGVPTMWLEVIYKPQGKLDLSKRPFKMEKEQWLSSLFYEKAYMNFMALVLLHDMSTWAYVPIATRNKIFQAIDWVEPETAQFVGYWDFPKSTFMDQMYLSYYQSLDKKKLLVVISNLSNGIKEMDSSALKDKINLTLKNSCIKWNVASLNNKKPFVKAIVRPKNFDLLMIECN